MLSIFIIASTIGVFSGLMAGLLGVGGGLVIVPVLLYFLPQWGVDEQISTHCAIATSLATILITGLSSVYSHHRQQGVLWPLFFWLMPGVALGAGVGAVSVTFLSAELLQVTFGALMMILAARMAIGSSPKVPVKTFEVWTCLPFGLGIGWVSALAGIGGGSLTVPFLVHRSIAIRQAVGTASACGVPIALAGSIGFIIAGIEQKIDAPGTLGYIHWPAFLGIVSTSVVTATLGAKLAHRLPALMLKKIFAVFLLLIGSKILFSALGQKLEAVFWITRI